MNVNYRSHMILPRIVNHLSWISLSKQLFERGQYIPPTIQNITSTFYHTMNIQIIRVEKFQLFYISTYTHTQLWIYVNNSTLNQIDLNLSIIYYSHANKDIYDMWTLRRMLERHLMCHFIYFNRRSYTRTKMANIFQF